MGRVPKIFGRKREKSAGKFTTQYKLCCCGARGGIGLKKRAKKLWVSRMLSGLVAFSLLLGGLPLIAAKAYSTESQIVSSFTVSCDGTSLSLGLEGRSYSSQEPVLTLIGQDGSRETYLVVISQDNIQLLKDWAPVSGASAAIQRDNTEAGNWGEAYQGVLTVPLASLPLDRFSLEFMGTAISAAELGFSEEAPESTPESAVESGLESTSEDKPESGITSEPESSVPPVEEETRKRPADTTGRITVDGSAEDWSAVTPVSLSGVEDQGIKINSLRTAMDTEGNVYLCFEGSANQYNLPNAKWIMVNITQNGVTQQISLDSLCQQGGELQTGGEVGNSDGPVVVEVKLPAGYFADSDFTISYRNTSFPASGMPVMDGTELEKPEPVYEGIVIDGSFSDWDAVKKYPGNDPGGNLDCVSAVFDGDWIYFYLKDTPSGNAANAGSHGNGKYSLKTDLGHELLFQLNADGTVNCPAEGASARHVGTQWEVAIPASALPSYLNTFDFGLYLHDPIITEVANLNGQGSGGSFEGIVYDGLYGDWTYYPHTTIQYDTQGTQEESIDASGALYTSGTTLYGHVKTTVPDHLAQKGYELCHAVTIRFNESSELHFRLVSVAEDGTIDYNTNVGGLAPGTYEYYILETNDSQELKNINNTDPNAPPWYGKMMITVKEGVDEGEFYLDLEKLAKTFDCGVGDFKTISAQFGELGQQWITIAGTSSGAWLGVLLCLAAVVGVGGWRRRRGGVKES